MHLTPHQLHSRYPVSHLVISLSQRRNHERGHFLFVALNYWEMKLAFIRYKIEHYYYCGTLANCCFADICVPNVSSCHEVETIHYTSSIPCLSQQEESAIGLNASLSGTFLE